MLYDARDCAALRNGVLFASVAAWALLLVTPGKAACHSLTLASGDSLAQLFAAQSLASASYGWFVMLVAMMGPMTLPALYQVRSSSFVKSRWSSSALFLLGYALVWMGAGAVLTTAELVLAWVEPDSLVPAVGMALGALVWQASPAKQRCLNRCHNHRSLAAFGFEAARDALLLGLNHGVWCVGSCWAMMLFPMLLRDGHFPAMAAVTLVMVCERLDPPSAPAWRLRGFSTAARWLRMKAFGLPVSPPPYFIARRLVADRDAQPVRAH